MEDVFKSDGKDDERERSSQWGEGLYIYSGMHNRHVEEEGLLSLDNSMTMFSLNTRVEAPQKA